jgi:hypothetical protein
LSRIGCRRRIPVRCSQVSVCFAPFVSGSFLSAHVVPHASPRRPSFQDRNSPPSCAFFLALVQLDDGLAPYPSTEGLAHNNDSASLEVSDLYRRWKSLSSCVSPLLVKRVFWKSGEFHSMTPSANASEDEAKLPHVGDADDILRLTIFDLKRSFPPRATVTEVTQWSQDKSWLLQSLFAQASSMSWSERCGCCGRPMITYPCSFD